MKKIRWRTHELIRIITTTLITAILFILASPAVKAQSLNPTDEFLHNNNPAKSLHQANEPLKIMPIGDSITKGTYGSSDGVGFRNDLYDLLHNDRYDFVFVGDSGTAPYNGHFRGGGNIDDFLPTGIWGGKDR